MKTTMKMVLGCLAACLAFDAMAAEVSQVVVRQRWPWSRLVDIDYVLACDPSEKMDVSVAAYNGSETLLLPLSSFSGDLYDVSEGTHRIVWDPMATVYTNSGALTSFRVALTPTSVPLYMIVDLTKSAGASDQIAYVYESDLTNDLWGAWVRNPVTNAGTVVESVIWTGVTTNDIYKTDKLVLRRIRAGTFMTGDTVPPTVSTTLTKDFYAGVFEVTQCQWELITGTGAKPSYFYTDYATRPVEKVSYDDIRGATNSVPSVNWPGTGVSVMPSSLVGKLRAKTGMADFDLPTEAQWECLCRAGTQTYYNDGIAGTPSNSQMDVLGRYKFDGGYQSDGVTAPAQNCGPTNGTAVVGSYQANAWGLYDTQGNVWEWCLDCFSDSNLARVRRGGSWSDTASSCRPAYRGSISSLTPSFILGFRLVRTLP